MLSVSSFHHGITGKPQILFGVPSQRNSISWSPHGRSDLGVFGNLAGGIDFWDVNRKKIMPHTYGVTMGKYEGLRDNNGSCAVGDLYYPLSRMFAISTTSPRMNVDKCVCIYKYYGRDVKDELGWDNAPYLPDHLLEEFWIPPARKGGEEDTDTTITERIIYPHCSHSPPTKKRG